MIFSSILAFLGKLPNWLKTGLAVGALFLVFEIKHRIDTAKLNGQIVKLSSELKEEQVKSIQLDLAIGQQNLSIQKMKVDQQKIAQDAEKRALSVLKKGAISSQELKSPASPIPSGADGMNEWLRSKMMEVQK